jgi:hypothetical protein
MDARHQGRLMASHWKDTHNIRNVKCCGNCYHGQAHLDSGGSLRCCDKMHREIGYADVTCAVHTLSICNDYKSLFD